jgi:hypothetical protein
LRTLVAVMARHPVSLPYSLAGGQVALAWFPMQAISPL